MGLFSIQIRFSVLTLAETGFSDGLCISVWSHQIKKIAVKQGPKSSWSTRERSNLMRHFTYNRCRQALLSRVRGLGPLQMWIIHKILWITVQCFSLVVQDTSSTSLEWKKNKKRRYHRVPICRWASIRGHFHSFDLWPQFSSSVIPERAGEPRGCQWITRQFPVSAFTTDCTGGFWRNTTSVTLFRILRDCQLHQERQLSGSEDWHMTSKEGVHADICLISRQT